MRLEKLWDDLRTTLWFRSAVWVIGLGLVALLLILLEKNGVKVQLFWLFSGQAGSAQVILGTIGGVMVTVTTLAFSLVIVAVVQTANAYSPRILRLYLTDTVNQDVGGILIGTFLFSLLTLLAVNTSDGANFVPTLAVTGAIILSLFAIGAFIYFIDHVAHSLEVDNMISLIMRDTVDLLPDLFPGTLGQTCPVEAPLALPAAPPLIALAPHSGYIQYIDPETLLEVASEQDLLIRIERHTGDYVLSGTPLAQVWPRTTAETDIPRICAAFQLGTERILVQDLLFGVRQLSDIALRAISPAVNDPSTAVNCIDALATLLAKMARLAPVSPYRCNAAGVLRVMAPGPTFEATLDLAFNQIRQYAARDYACTLRLIEVCGEIGYVADRPEYRAALGRHLAMLARSADQNFTEPHDREQVNKRLSAAASVLQQDVN